MPNPDLAARTRSSPSRRMPLVVAGAALFAVASGVLFYYATPTATGPKAGTVYKVTVGDRSCEPNDLTVPAGRAAFEIYNASNRPLEWEILDGVMVVEERENIAPGFRSTLTAKLQPGAYEITCGLLSNPRGTLVVTPSAASEAEKIQPPPRAFVGPLAEYKVFLSLQASALVEAAEQLAAAIGAGDLATAKILYPSARLPYKRVEAVTGRIADLENVIDPVADYLVQRGADPAFIGFHRIEYGLFAQNSLEGLASVADRLVADTTALKARLRAMKLAPDELAGSAERQARRLAEEQIAKGENRYAHTDLAEFEANIEGMTKSVALLDPILSGAAPAVATKVKETFATTVATLAALKTPAGYPAYDQIDRQAKDRLAQAFRALAEALAKINPAMGIG